MRWAGEGVAAGASGGLATEPVTGVEQFRAGDNARSYPARERHAAAVPVAAGTYW